MKPLFNFHTGFSCSVKRERGRYCNGEGENKSYATVCGRQFGNCSWNMTSIWNKGIQLEALLGLLWVGGLESLRSVWLSPAPDLYFITILISRTKSLPYLLSGPPEFSIPRTSPNHWPHILLGSHRILELLGSWRGSIPFWDSVIQAEGLLGFALELHSFYFSHKNRVRGQFPNVLHFHLCSSLDLIGSYLHV